ncbi:hypothetical protein ABBQ38_010415 [Trebouxia sp. C0009 RCD-2024]
MNLCKLRVVTTKKSIKKQFLSGVDRAFPVVPISQSYLSRKASSRSVGGRHAGCCQARQAPSLTLAVRPEEAPGSFTNQNVLSQKSQAQESAIDVQPEVFL